MTTGRSHQFHILGEWRHIVFDDVERQRAPSPLGAPEDSGIGAFLTRHVIGHPSGHMGWHLGIITVTAEIHDVSNQLSVAAAIHWRGSQ